MTSSSGTAAGTRAIEAAHTLKSGIPETGSVRSLVSRLAAEPTPVKGHEERVRPLVRGDPRPHVCRAPPGRDGDEIALGDVVTSASRGCWGDEGSRSRGHEFGDPSGLGAGLVVMQQPPGRQIERCTARTLSAGSAYVTETARARPLGRGPSRRAGCAMPAVRDGAGGQGVGDRQ